MLPKCPPAFWISLSIAILCRDALAAVSYAGYRLTTVSPKSAQDIRFLFDLEKLSWVDLWSSVRAGHATSVLIHPSMMPVVQFVLRMRGMQLHPVAVNVQRLIDEEKRNNIKTVPRNEFHLYKYNTYKEIHEWLQIRQITMSITHPSYMKSSVIGKSYEGRDIIAVSISDSEGERAKPAIMLQCGIHAREWIAIAVCVNFIHQLTENVNDEAVRPLVEHFEWIIVPVSNPDGYEYSHQEDRMWRKTRSPNAGSECIGSDINRNYDFHFGKLGTSPNPCAQNYPGPHAFSEVETQALRDLVLSVKDRLIMFIDIHSFSQVFVYPWSYENVPLHDSIDLELLAKIGSVAAFREHGKHYDVDQSAALLGATAGSCDDWAKGVVGTKFTFTFELRDKGEHGFILPADQIQPTFQEIFSALSAMAEAIFKSNFYRL